ncbi:DODA-type extradiol aromatic ring-opening family dioxygenase [Aquabacterium sp. OR-4]|uniref:DODA-type extradiol aromatic ring-opening family dioxygenase n=1 Tax=Aquabacterium sp. OR-4 TaxID=2978127 RepID=UPI0021B1C4B3|nr:class III extradiol ring-cleavage dioxygenase [Aquabacterium sp. OR-4]MDT7836600.1 class III extradiol ring-cleavage dioxygenase [Aquabacterium sp. OR-4]
MHPTPRPAAATAAPLAPIYLSHGSPMTALEPGAAGPFWQTLGRQIDAQGGPPRAILAISAHTLTREPVLMAAARHSTIHDFSGFPEALYRLRYDAPGAPALAQRVAALLQGAGLPAHVLPEGGLDHGIWSPLRFAWPEADIPVLPLGFPPDWSPARLFALGQALAPLAAEGVLIYGSGSLTHNLRLVFGARAGGMPALDAPEIAESAAFRHWFAERSAAGTDSDWDALLDYRRQAPHAALMHPTDEHLLPFYVAAGAAGRVPARRLHDSLTYGCLGMDAYAFGPQAERLA